MPADLFVVMAAADQFVHAWDLATATGETADLDPDLAAQFVDVYPGRDRRRVPRLRSRRALRPARHHRLVRPRRATRRRQRSYALAIGAPTRDGVDNGVRATAKPPLTSLRIADNESFRAPKGTHDVLPPESARWQDLIARFAEHVTLAGYGLHVPPMFEHYEVFARVGEATDIVRKEMYDFDDKGGRHLALRPEGTASVVRAYIEHRPTPPWKVWYAAPSFRYEAPQAGRYRQHVQVGIEALGSDDPDLDVEVIALQSRFYESLGLRRIRLNINSLGDADTRPRYLELLHAHFESAGEDLSAQSRETLATNPLRVLDSKRPQDAEIIARAPVMTDVLSDAAAAHFERVQAGLDSLGVEYHLEPRLVRGLDYYTRTTFEFAAEALEGAQNGVGGGGRYDGLAEQMGGPPTPGIGFGSGVERILLACDAEGAFGAATSTVDAFVIDVAGGSHALELTHALRAAGVRTDRSFDERSMKAQMKQADRAGARLALIVGEQEAADKTVTVRDLATSQQEVVTRADVVEHVRKTIQ